MEIKILELDEKDFFEKTNEIIQNSNAYNFGDYTFFTSELMVLTNIKDNRDVDVFKINLSTETVDKIKKENKLIFFDRIERKDGIYYRRTSKKQQLIIISVSNNK